MIQRIQTLYLILAFILSMFSFTTPLVRLADNSDNNYSITLTGLIQKEGDVVTVSERSLLLTLIIATIPIVILLTIALFKYRKYQMNLILFATFLILSQIATCGLLLTQSIQKYGLFIQFSTGLIFPPIVLVLMFLAWRGVRKDDNLVKSYDRMR